MINFFKIIFRKIWKTIRDFIFSDVKSENKLKV